MFLSVLARLTNDMDFILAAFWIAVIACLALLVVGAVLWALNTLFALGLAYTLKNALAVFVLSAVVHGSSSYTRD